LDPADSLAMKRNRLTRSPYDRRPPRPGTGPLPSSGGAAAEGQAAQDEGEDDPPGDDEERGAEVVDRVGGGGDGLCGLDEVGQREHLGEELEGSGQVLTGNEEAAEEELGQHHGRHELDRL